MHRAMSRYGRSIKDGDCSGYCVGGALCEAARKRVTRACTTERRRARLNRLLQHNTGKRMQRIGIGKRTSGNDRRPHQKEQEAERRLTSVAPRA